nr:hypothetical protein [uncultured Pseudomonas sp.]
MTSNCIWLEIHKGNGAILSYFLECPETSSATVDYIQASKDELLYLNLLEDNVLPPGVVVTLSDLVSHRERLLSTEKKSAALPPKPNKKSTQKPVESNIKASTNKQQANKKLTKSEFMAGFKQIERPRKQGEQ